MYHEFGYMVSSKGEKEISKVLVLQTVDAIDAALVRELAQAADGLIGRGAAGGAGGEVHLAFGVLVH